MKPSAVGWHVDLQDSVQDCENLSKHHDVVEPPLAAIS